MKGEANYDYVIYQRYLRYLPHGKNEIRKERYPIQERKKH